MVPGFDRLVSGPGPSLIPTSSPSAFLFTPCCGLGSGTSLPKSDEKTSAALPGGDVGLFPSSTRQFSRVEKGRYKYSLIARGASTKRVSEERELFRRVRPNQCDAAILTMFLVDKPTQPIRVAVIVPWVRSFNATERHLTSSTVGGLSKKNRKSMDSLRPEGHCVVAGEYCFKTHSPSRGIRASISRRSL